MRVAVITSKFPCSPKAEMFFIEEARQIARACDLILAPASAGKECVYPINGATVVADPMMSWRTIVAAAAAWRRAPRECAAALRLIITTGSPGIRLKNLAVFPKALALAQRFKDLRVQHVHAYWLSVPATIAMIVARINGVPWSATGHRWDIYEGNLRLAKIQSARFVRVISERGARDLALCVPSEYRAKIRCIRIGVEIPPARAPRTGRDEMRIVCPALLVPVKGHETLLRGLALLKERGIAYSCVCAGDGPLLDDLRKRARELAIADRVVFAGLIPHGELLQELRGGAYDAVVLCSIERGTTMEGAPVALMEAMAAGVPCVATSSGSVPELLGNGAGILVPCEDPQALAGALEKLATSEDFALDVIARARSRAVEDFNVEKNAARVCSLFGSSATVSNYAADAGAELTN